MKNFNEYIIEKLKITNNSKILTLGDIYKISKLACSIGASMEPERFLKRIDEVFGINKLYELQNEYIDYFEKYKDNDDPRIKNEDIKKLCKIILNIIFSVPHDMTIHDGVERLLDDCNIPPNKAKLVNIDRNSTYINLTYDNSLLFYFKFDKR